MNWFERHLNWTALLLAAGGVVAFEALTRISFGFNNIFWEDLSFLGSLRIIWVGIVVLCCFLFSLFAYGWILQRKNRSAWLLSFYIVIGGLCLAALLYQVIPNSDYWITDNTLSPTSLFTLATLSPLLETVESVNYVSVAADPTLPVLGFLIILTYGIAWITVLSLRTKDQPASNMMGKIFAPGKWKKRIVFPITLTTIIVALSSGLFFRFGYLHFDSSDLNNPDMPDFSFDYPASYMKPVEREYYYFEPPIPPAIDLNRALLFGDYWYIYIKIYNEQDTELLKEIPGTIQEYVYTSMEFHSPYDERQLIVDTPTIIDGIPAHQLSLSVSRKPYEMINSGTAYCVYFEHENRLWIIKCMILSEVRDYPPPYFTRLLESFKIYD